MFSVGSIIELEDKKEYIVISNAEFEGKVYYFIMEEQNQTNVKFCVEKVKDEKTYFEEFSDKKLFMQLQPLFEKSSKEFLSKNK